MQTITAIAHGISKIIETELNKPYTTNPQTNHRYICDKAPSTTHLYIVYYDTLYAGKQIKAYLGYQNDQIEIWPGNPTNNSYKSHTKLEYADPQLIEKLIKTIKQLIT